MKAFPAAIREAAVRDYVAGEASQTVAARYGVSSSTVTDWVRKAGHPVRGRGGGVARPPAGYTGGWVVRGGIKVPLCPAPRSQ